MSEKIDYEKDEDILREALDRWGFRLQAVIAIEEMSELTKVLCKFLRKHELEVPVYEDITEEIADVQIMLWQLSLQVGRKGVQDNIEIKLQRLAKRLNHD